MPYLQSFFYFLVMVLIIFAAYLTSRWFASHSMSMAHGKYIKLVDRIALSKDKWIFIIQVGKRIQLMAEDSVGMFKLTDLDESDLVLLEQQGVQTSFQEMISSYLANWAPRTAEQSSHLPDNLSELKNKVSESLSHMMKINQRKESTHDQKEEIL